MTECDFLQGWHARRAALQEDAETHLRPCLPPADRIAGWMDYLISSGGDEIDYGRGIIAHCLEELKAGGQTEAPKPDPE